MMQTFFPDKGEDDLVVGSIVTRGCEICRAFRRHTGVGMG